MDPDVRFALEEAIRAPSGENCQPWRFIVNGTTIELWNRPERDQSPYGWGQRASYVANGAALENFVLAAGLRGLAASVEYFPEGNGELVARIILSRGGALQDPLVSEIQKRVSNRKPYKKTPLMQEQKNALAMTTGDVKVFVRDDADSIRTIAEVGATNERVMLGNRSLHGFFFSHLNWNKKEDDEKKVGFYIKTLELPPPAQAAFRLIQHWSVARVLKKVGFPSAVFQQNAAMYAAAGAVGAITTQGIEPLDFVLAGRLLERLWLTATKLGLSFQPLAGIPYLYLEATRGERALFDAAETSLISSAYERAVSVFGTGKVPIVFLFRVGESEPPTARSSRFSFDESVEVRS